MITPDEYKYDIRLKQLKLSDSTKLALDSNEMYWISEVAQYTQAELLRRPNFGRRALDELAKVFKALDIEFGTQNSYPIASPRIARSLAETANIALAEKAPAAAGRATLVTMRFSPDNEVDIALKEALQPLFKSAKAEFGGQMPEAVKRKLIRALTGKTVKQAAKPKV